MPFSGICRFSVICLESCSLILTAHNYYQTNRFVSGGDLSPDQGKDTATIYMLSIPAMNWWRISQLGTPISGHACEVIGKRHMVQVGGSPPPGRNGETSTPAGSGVTLFDMTNLKSVSQFDPAAADYETPSLAQTWYADSNNLKGVEWTDAATQALLTGSKLHLAFSAFASLPVFIRFPLVSGSGY